MISNAILARKDAIRESYQTAKPFRHVCLDGFLEPSQAERLLAEFPPFDPKLAMNEMGEVGGKAVNTDLRSIGPAYREFFDYMCSRPFLDAMSDMLGVPDLLFDSTMYGGGTHENLHGQELDPHVDFNYDTEQRLHRRLNLLIYLNKEWDLSWGGGIELHSDPRDWDHDEIKTFNCEFNRGVIFETNEHSWHGFKRIQLPEAKRGLSRKCISIYLYSRTRPKEEIAPPHSTFYVQRPLPAEIVPGHTMTAEDILEVKRLLIYRDHWIREYQRQELQRGREQLERGNAQAAQRQPSSLLSRNAVRGRFERVIRLFKGLSKAAVGRFRRAAPPKEGSTQFAALRKEVVSRRYDIPEEALREAGKKLDMDCLLCKQRAARHLIIGHLKPTQAGKFAVKDYRLVSCEACGTVYINPLPTQGDLKALYQDSTQFDDPVYTDPERVELILANLRDRFSKLKLFPQPGESCLEVGAGLAWATRVCKEHDGRIVTVAQDITDECVGHCPWVDRFTIGPVESIPTAEKFKLISMTHVIEHLLEPRMMLGHLAGRLQEGGHIFVTGPYRPQLWQEKDGIGPWLAYSYLHVPAHVSYLSERWFEQAAQQCGLKLVTWDPAHDYHQAFEAVLRKA